MFKELLSFFDLGVSGSLTKRCKASKTSFNADAQVKKGIEQCIE